MLGCGRALLDDNARSRARF